MKILTPIFDNMIINLIFESNESFAWQFFFKIFFWKQNKKRFFVINFWEKLLLEKMSSFSIIILFFVIILGKIYFQFFLLSLNCYHRIKILPAALWNFFMNYRNSNISLFFNFFYISIWNKTRYMSLTLQSFSMKWCLIF